MRKLILRMRIAWLDASIVNALQDLTALRIRRDAALARLEEIKYRESRQATLRTINALAKRADNVNPHRASVVAIRPLPAGDVVVLGPDQLKTDQH